MTFADWIAQNCPGYLDKLNACFKELQDAAEVVDIDYLKSKLSIGSNKGSDISVLSEQSKGRCKVHLNTKTYDGMEFPHVVFLNMRQGYSDKHTGRAVPSVVDTVSVLFEMYKANKPITQLKNVQLAKERTAPDLNILVQQMRGWLAKMAPYSETVYSQYLVRAGIKTQWILDDPLTRNAFRVGYSARYGRHTAFPLRYPQHNTFMGFQRIYDDGMKVLVKGFNPTGLCGYLATDEAALTPDGVKCVLLHEGWANGLLAHYMCKLLGMSGVANIIGLYADNLPSVVNVIASEFHSAKVVLDLYDNDANQKGLQIAKRCQEIYPRLQIDCFSRNDLKAVVLDFGFDAAFKEFRDKLRIALKKAT